MRFRLKYKWAQRLSAWRQLLIGSLFALLCLPLSGLASVAAPPGASPVGSERPVSEEEETKSLEQAKARGALSKFRRRIDDAAVRKARAYREALLQRDAGGASLRTPRTSFPSCMTFPLRC